MTPAGGAFGAGGVVDGAGAAAAHVVVEPQGTKTSAGETDSRDVPDDAGKPATGDPAAGQTGAGSSTDPVLKPATATTTTTTVTKTTATKTAKPKTATVASTSLPKTSDNNWIAASMTLYLLGTALLAAVYRC